MKSAQQHIIINKNSVFYRFLEILIPAFTWGIITMPIWLSPFHPAVVSYLILGYLVYFSYKALKNVYFAVLAYKFMSDAEKINWKKKVLKLSNYSQYHHFLVVVTATESLEKLDQTLSHFNQQDFNKKQINVVLAMEEKFKDIAEPKSVILRNKYAHEFASFHVTYHRLMPGEVQGKASNESYACKQIYKIIEKKHIDPKHVIMTICDGDSLLPSSYLSYVTYKYILEKEPEYKFFWAPVLLYNNFWNLKLPVRMQTILSSVMRIAFLPQTDDLIQISTYSVSLWLLHSVGYWDVDIIPEDWHLQLQAFFTHGSKVKTVPIYLPIIRDGVYAPETLKAFKSRYTQEMRWAWGVSDVPYAIARAIQATHIPFFVKLKKLLFISEIHLLWPTSFFILTISGWLPPLLNPAFKRTVLGFLLPQLSSLILTFTSILLVAIVYIDYKLRNKVNIKTSPQKIPLLIIQWYLLPVISFFFSSLPALEAHTRLMLGKKIIYNATEKK